VSYFFQMYDPGYWILLSISDPSIWTMVKIVCPRLSALASKRTMVP